MKTRPRNQKAGQADSRAQTVTIVVEAFAAALIMIALGMMIEADTRDMRVRLQRRPASR